MEKSHGNWKSLQSSIHVASVERRFVLECSPRYRVFRYAYVRREVALSAEIEGTQWSPPDLLMFEGGELRGAPLQDVHEVPSQVALQSQGLAHGPDNMAAEPREKGRTLDKEDT
ncbi:MAG: Fic/DOC family N-terminal domain-containing protein [Terriglobia bacterium]